MATLCCDPVGDDGEGGCQRAGWVFECVAVVESGWAGEPSVSGGLQPANYHKAPQWDS